MKVVIVGGVAGGASGAARLRRLDESAEIVMFERGEYISFANCGLPYYIGGDIRRKSDLTLQTPESFHSRFNVDVRVLCEVTAIHPEARQVSVRDHRKNRVYRETYDKLLLAPGALPILPRMEGVDGDRVFTLRTIPDTLAIKEFVESQKPRRAVVVGGGAVGLETAENLVEAGLEVTVVELADHVIATIDRDMAADVHNYLAGQGLRLKTGDGLRGIAGTGPLTLTLDSGTLETDMVVLSVGVRPENTLAKGAGLALGERGHIVVDDHMRTSDPHIYAVGDAVEAPDWLTGQSRNYALAGPANRQGRIAADNIAGLDSRYDGAQGSAILKVFGLTAASTGMTERMAQAQGIDWDAVHLSSASHATYYPGASMIASKVVFERNTGRLLGGQFVGAQGVDKRCDVLATAIRANMTAADLTRLELCYAPPYSSAKDPINMAGFVMENILTGKMNNAHWTQLPGLDRKGCLLLDVRTAGECQRGHIRGALHIPVDSLRAQLDRLPPEGEVYIFCHSGQRSYLACRILAAHGRTCHNISGGWRLYSAQRAAGFLEELVW